MYCNYVFMCTKQWFGRFDKIYSLIIQVLDHQTDSTINWELFILLFVDSFPILGHLNVCLQGIQINLIVNQKLFILTFVSAVWCVDVCVLCYDCTKDSEHWITQLINEMEEWIYFRSIVPTKVFELTELQNKYGKKRLNIGDQDE